MALRAAAGRHVVFFDGVCGMCHGFVQFVLRRDRGDRFRFATLQGALAADVLPPLGGNPDRLSTMYVLADAGTEQQRLLCRGRAALFVLTGLGGGWRVFRVLSFLPGLLLDAGYGLVARVRYALFGRLAQCPVPTAEHRARFLEIDEKRAGGELGKGEEGES